VTSSQARPLVLLYGGSFDPVHLGHVRVFWEAAWRLKATAAHWLPCYQSPLKARTPAAPEHRLAMLQLVCEELNTAAGAARFSVDPREVHRTGASYTWETLAQWRRELGPDARLVWLMGMDSWNQLSQWQQWTSLTDYAHLLVLQRPGQCASPSPEQQEWAQDKWAESLQALQDQSCGLIYALKNSLLAIASAGIRDDIARGLAPVGLVPSAIQSYLHQHRLYQEP
jgi:nicotinate-nucleotide adenylyltransferase